MTAKPRIGLLALRWDMFDPVLPPGYLREMEALANRAAELLAEQGDVVYPGLISNEAAGAAAGRTFEASVDVIVVFPCMAAPPSFGWAALAGLSHTPVVVWNAHVLDGIPDSFGASDNVRHSSNVGALMLTNVLAREGRSFAVCTGHWGDAEFTNGVAETVRAGAAAGRLRRARLGVLGDPIPGYLDVMVDEQTLKRDLGVELVRISSEELTETFREVTSEEEELALAEMRSRAVEGVSETAQAKSARLAIALERLVTKHRLDGGAINCHTAYFRRNALIGIVGCYGVSYLLQRGVPFTCTGDIPTAVAALTVRFLGAQPQWCECVMIDYEQDFMLLSNTGEGNPAMAASPSSIRIVPNEQFEPGCDKGACLTFPLRPGPATLIGLSPRKSARGGWSLTIAEGSLLEKHFPRIGTPNGGFRFKNLTAAASFNRWCQGGAAHHGIVTSGSHAQSLVTLAEFLGIEPWVV